jgi:hypothetical protein
MVSRPEGLHLKPLAEPYVRLSPHTAPVSQPWFCRINAGEVKFEADENALATR